MGQCGRRSQGAKSLTLNSLGAIPDTDSQGFCLSVAIEKDTGNGDVKCSLTLGTPVPCHGNDTYKQRKQTYEWAERKSSHVLTEQRQTRRFEQAEEEPRGNQALKVARCCHPAGGDTPAGNCGAEYGRSHQRITIFIMERDSRH